VTDKAEGLATALLREMVRRHDEPRRQMTQGEAAIDEGEWRVLWDCARALAAGQGTPQAISPPDEHLRIAALAIHPIWGRGN
jgi:hypothetical protein